MTEKELELIKKINALAQNGVGGEKINAEEKLKEYLKKHNISLEDLESLDSKIYYYKTPNPDTMYYRIFKQIVANFKIDILCTGLKDNIIGFYLTAKENIELQARIDFYLARYKEDEQIFFESFIYKNNLYAGIDESKPTEEDIKRFQKVLNMSTGLENHKYNKQITNN